MRDTRGCYATADQPLKPLEGGGVVLRAVADGFVVRKSDALAFGNLLGRGRLSCYALDILGGGCGRLIRVAAAPLYFFI
eukprot:1183094-Prorocentrum_minimum.AAC.2